MRFSWVGHPHNRMCQESQPCLWSKNSPLCFVYGYLQKICDCLIFSGKLIIFMLRIKVLCGRGCLGSEYMQRALQCSPAQTMGSGFFSAIASVLLYLLQTIWNCIDCCSLHIPSFFYIWISNICFHSDSS